MASFVASVNGQAVVTLDYGSGSPEEAAAELAYLNAPVGSTTPIGEGLEWSDSANAWEMVNWQTAGYWASLRAATPLPVDDGLNFMRLGRTAPFGFHTFEVGNEEYGSWEIDHHTAQHDPATYVAFAKQFQTFAATIDPSISIGIDAGSPDDSYNNWVPDVLQQSVMQGFTIGFISDHNYVQAPGSGSDSTLLLDTVSDPSSPYDWAVRAAAYTSLLDQYLGSAAASVELLTTEFNSVYSNPGKQTTSLVNGLFIADSLGELLQTPYDGAIVWDLRNGYDTTENNSPSLYGWREGGDYGLLGSSPDDPPATGTYVPYPSYFAEQLASNIIQAGGSVVQASSNDPNLAVYAVDESNGDLDLLVINKSPSGPITGQFALTGYQPQAQAQLLQYGEAQDTAQSLSSTGQSALASTTAVLPVSGSSFSFAFPAYSMSVLELSPGATGPTITVPAAAVPSPVTGTSTALSVSATDPAGAGALIYTWSTIAPSPAGVAFSVNGTNAAQDTTATFSQAGTYTFEVIASDPSGMTAKSGVPVTVDQTLTLIKVIPQTVTIAANANQPFTAQAGDQFSILMSPEPSFAWSLASGVGSINPATGVYSAPGAAGSAVVEASSGGVQGTANVTVSPPPGPTITNIAAAMPSPVTGTTTALSVSATDPAGAGALVYTWSTIAPSPAGVVFSVNGTNAAQDTTAIFSQAGTYTFEVIASDPSGMTAKSGVPVTVDQTLTLIKVSPQTVTIAANANQPFTAQAGDQFSILMSSEPSFAWSLASGVGSINPATGVYSAPGTAGSAMVEASSGSVHGTASVTVTLPSGPTITRRATAAPSPVTGTSTALSVSAIDPAGAGALIYTWSPIAPSTAGVVFSVNGTSAAQDTMATFSRAGTYTFKVIASDLSGHTATSEVTVTVDQTLTSIKVSPQTATVPAGTTQPFTAQAGDQFGNLMSPEPGCTWSLAGGTGSVNSATGLYSAPGATGSAVVEASSAGVHGTASVTVTPPSGTALPPAARPRPSVTRTAMTGRADSSATS